MFRVRSFSLRGAKSASETERRSTSKLLLVYQGFIASIIKVNDIPHLPFSHSIFSFLYTTFRPFYVAAKYDRYYVCIKLYDFSMSFGLAVSLISNLVLCMHVSHSYSLSFSLSFYLCLFLSLIS